MFIKEYPDHRMNPRSPPERHVDIAEKHCTKIQNRDEYKAIKNGEGQVLPVK